MSENIDKTSKQATGLGKTVTSTLGNTLGGLTDTLGDTVGSAGSGLGNTINSATGQTGVPVGDMITNLTGGVSGAAKSLGKGIKDTGEMKKPGSSESASSSSLL
ncbi:hypothetical protein QBC38DRAFT_223186 [Podospora fimiseda]|uniref:Uncharacterized protein n=1 Tax=Podospora fimiseda TaxID=252190 RepID=A0AAN7BY00_9PEZI|nr:hypothetical protein QBC38DRAFT_223186 [Podospora fimiseda]